MINYNKRLNDRDWHQTKTCQHMEQLKWIVSVKELYLEPRHLAQVVNESL
jgi:hypothetical protein